MAQVRWKRCFSFTLQGVALLALVACGAIQAPWRQGSAEPFIPPEPPSGYQAKAIAYAPHDMVAAAHPLAVQTGVEILARGGSAIDAAIAAQMVLTLVEPQSSGIGGGGFLLHYDSASRQVRAYDGRETAPKAATADLFVGPDGKPLPFLKAVDSGLSVGTPGLLRMLEDTHQAHGKLPWKDLFAPAIRLSEQGFAISPRMAVSIATAAPRIRAQGEPAARYFLNADGSPKAAGTWLKNPELAATLRAVAEGGAQAFYRGEIARDIVAKVRSHPTQPGRLALEDLAGYQAKLRDPVCSVYRVHHRICGMPAPSSGGLAVLQTLGMLQRFDLAAVSPNSLDAVHLVSEAYRLAYADRARYVADPDFVTVPQAGLLDSAYLQARAALIDPQKTMGTSVAGTPPGITQAWGPDPALDRPATTHLSIVDRAGNAVSMTTSIEYSFGSLQMVRGFLLNNQLTDFSFTGTDAAGQPIANRVEPGKRPRSSMAPMLVFNAQTGDLEAAIGSPGGSAIVQYTAKSLIGLIDWKLNVQQAINLPHFGAQTNAITAIEQGSVLDTAAIREGLQARGHTVAVTDRFTSGLHGVVFNGLRANGQPGLLARNLGAGTYAGGADPRREGVALGN